MRLAAPLPWVRSAALVLGVAAAIAAVASPAWAGGGNVVSGPEARQWLLRMHNAATQRNYQGTLVVSAEGGMSSSRIAHYCEGKESFETVDMLDGQPRRVLRHNEQVLTLWPNAKTARLEQREAIQPFPSLLTGSEEQLFERYELVSEGPGRVAGFDAAVFVLRPRDGARFAQRLWAEQGSGLLLRADVVAADGRVLESSAFTDLTIGGKTKPQPGNTVQGALKHLDGWRVLKPASQRTSLEAEGWQLKAPVAGFRQSSCVKRQLEPAADDNRQTPAEVLHAIFTDGSMNSDAFVAVHRAVARRPPPRWRRRHRRHTHLDAGPWHTLDHRGRRCASGHAQTVRGCARNQAALTVLSSQRRLDPP
jgi:sigma-E factor negative regulatory protein RseB